jgi:hypothetical protein
MIDKASKLNRVEFVRSDISGKLFPADQCEMIVIKIVKGKEEDINSYNQFGAREVVRAPVGDAIKIPDVVKKESFIANVDSPEFKKTMERRNAIVPRALSDVFKKPAEVSGPYEGLQ